MTKTELIRTRFQEHAGLLGGTMQRLADRIEAAGDLIVRAYRQGRGVFLFGNGGSAADAQHIAGEFVGRFLKDRRALKAEALSTNTSTMTALANDFSFDMIFARQLEADAAEGDVAWGLSTSGNSPNVVAGLRYAREHGMRTVALTGEGGGRCAPWTDILLDVPSRSTPRIQEAGMLVYHLICELVESAMFVPT